MTRIRLQAQIMPWEGQGSAAPRAEARQQNIIKLCVPCLDTMTIQELADKIVAQWARIYVGYGSLDIKELKTVYNERLDIEETVGAYFDDRKDPDNKISSNEPPSNSIVRIYRFPPDPRELQNTVRFGSLMPESAARPRKRARNILQDIRNTSHTVASIEPQDDLPNRILITPNKRQRINENRTDEFATFERPKVPQGPAAESVHIVSQPTGTQCSIHQVYDSQGSSAKKMSNPYGTPTSLSLVSSQEPIPRHHTDITSIPDSPTSRRAISIDENPIKITSVARERTKSESPEIRLSVHDVPTLKVHEHTHTGILSPGFQETPHFSIPEIQPQSAGQGKDDSLEDSDGGAHERLPRSTDSTHIPPVAVHERPPDSRWDQAREPRECSSRDIFDIENITENSNDSRQMHGPKRLKPGPSGRLQSYSPCTRGRMSKDRYSPVLSNMKAPHDHSESPLGELTGLNNNVVDIQRTINGVEGSKSSDIGNPQGTSIFNDIAESSAIANHQDQTDTWPPQNEQPSAYSKHLELLYQAATAGSQLSDLPAKNWSHLDVEHPLKQALSQARRPDVSILPETKDQDQSKAGKNGHQFQDTKRRETKADAQHKDLRTRDLKPEQKGADIDAEDGHREYAKKDDEVQKAAEREKKELAVTRDGSIMDGNAQADHPAEAKTRNPIAPRGQKDVVASESPAQEFPLTQKPMLQNPIMDETTMREQRSKEKVLRESAEKQNLVDEGAKQIEIEKAQKICLQTPVSSRGKAIAKNPRAPYVRTEGQKARRRELAARDRQTTPQSKVARSRRLQSTQPNIQVEGLSCQSNEHIDTDTEEDKPLAKNAQNRPLNQELQKPKSSSAHRSSTPSEPNNINGQARKSLTPALPNPTVTKSSSVRGHLTSSSPLASRSSVQSNTPLRSALKQTQPSSALRRSVSFVHDGEDPANIFRTPSKSLATTSYVPTAPPIKTLVDINNELALPTTAASKASRKATLPKRETAKDNVVKKGMVQQKLNIAVDKKLKGRAVDTPASSRPSSEDKLDPSSNEFESDFESDSELDTGNGHAKAGPSSRKRHSGGVPRPQSTEIPTLPGSVIDPAIENMKSVGNSAAPLLPLRSNSISSASSEQKSVSRSPAQALSETASVSSGSGADSDSGSGSGSGSQSGSETESGSDSASELIEDVEPLGKDTRSSAGSSQSIGTDSELTAKIIKNHKKSGDLSGKIHRLSGQEGDCSVTTHGKNGDDEAAGQQLQLESSQPVPAKTAKAVSSPDHGITSYDKLLNQGLNRDGRLPDGTRPAYARYPKLSTLIKVPRAATPEGRLSMLPTPKGFAVASTEEQPNSSSSDESTSNSDDDEDEDEDGDANLPKIGTSSKSKGGVLRGLKGVMELAKGIRRPK